MVSQRDDISVSREAFSWLFASLCRRHRIPFDARLLLQRHPPSEKGYGPTEIAKAADEVGLKVGEAAVTTLAESIPLHFPILVFVRSTAESASDEGEAISPVGRPALVTGVTDGMLGYVEIGDEKPRQCPLDEIEQHFESVCYLFTPKSEPVRDEDGARKNRDTHHL